jgi:hypothetical protein
MILCFYTSGEDQKGSPFEGDAINRMKPKGPVEKLFRFPGFRQIVDAPLQEGLRHVLERPIGNDAVLVEQLLR